MNNLQQLEEALRIATAEAERLNTIADEAWDGYWRCRCAADTSLQKQHHAEHLLNVGRANKKTIGCACESRAKLQTRLAKAVRGKRAYEWAHEILAQLENAQRDEGFHEGSISQVILDGQQLTLKQKCRIWQCLNRHCNVRSRHASTGTVHLSPPYAIRLDNEGQVEPEPYCGDECLMPCKADNEGQVEPERGLLSVHCGGRQ